MAKATVRTRRSQPAPVAPHNSLPPRERKTTSPHVFVIAPGVTVTMASYDDARKTDAEVVSNRQVSQLRSLETRKPSQLRPPKARKGRGHKR